MHEPVIHIDTIHWELNTTSVDKARYWQDEVSRFTHENLPGIIQRSVNEMMYDDEDIVIPMIELDLPALHHPEDIAGFFETKWKERLEELLLIQSLAKQGVINRTEETRLSLSDQFLYYLRNGQLLWYSDKVLFADSFALYTKLTVLQQTQLSAMMEEALQQAGTYRRLVSYFTEEQLIELLQRSELFMPATESWYRFIDNWMADRLPGWRRHSYRTLILFLLVRVIAAGKFSPADDRAMLRQWWIQVTAENYFTKKEMQSLLFLAASIVSKPKDQENASGNTTGERLLLLTETIAGLTETTVSAGTQHVYTKEKIEEQKQTAETAQSYFIENAGLVLLYPYLKTWFREAELLSGQNAFNSPELQMKACRLLQAIAFGTIDFKEYHLVLNKVLCGYPLHRDVYGESVALTDAQEESDDKIAEVISHWDKVKTTSVEGFRNSFLLRNGKLTAEDDHFLLRVERKAWDVLLDTYPYPISIIKLPWMDKPLYTEW